METDVRQQADTIRFADGGRNENNVYVQNDDEFCLAVIRDGDGKEAEIESVDIDNLIEALKEFKRRVNQPIYRQEFKWSPGGVEYGPVMREDYDVAKYAYQQADAMLTEREKNNEE